MSHRTVVDEQHESWQCPECKFTSPATSSLEMHIQGCRYREFYGIEPACTCRSLPAGHVHDPSCPVRQTWGPGDYLVAADERARKRGHTMLADDVCARCGKSGRYIVATGMNCPGHSGLESAFARAAREAESAMANVERDMLDALKATHWHDVGCREPAANGANGQTPEQLGLVRTYHGDDSGERTRVLLLGFFRLVRVLDALRPGMTKGDLEMVIR